MCGDEIESVSAYESVSIREERKEKKNQQLRNNFSFLLSTTICCFSSFLGVKEKEEGKVEVELERASA